MRLEEFDGSSRHRPSVSLRARALWGQAHVAFYGGHYDLAASSATESIALAHAHGDVWAEARALITMGALQSLSAPADARASLIRSLAMGRANGDEWAEADGWKMITVSWYVQHDARTAGQSMRELQRAGSAASSSSPGTRPCSATLRGGAVITRRRARRSHALRSGAVSPVILRPAASWSAGGQRSTPTPATCHVHAND